MPTDRTRDGQEEWEEVEQRRILDAEIPETTRKALIRARIGQGLFKKRVCRIETPSAPPRPRPFNMDQRHFLNHRRREIFLSAVD